MGGIVHAGTETWHEDTLNWFFKETASIPGDIAEIGILSGETLAKLIMLAKSYNREKIVHGYDSFCGMAEPSDLDGDHYPKGKFDNRGKAFVQSELKRKYKINTTEYRLHEGFIPYCFIESAKMIFSLALIDVDHYLPTLCSLAWIWPRMHQGGIVAVHDYFPDQYLLASAAVKDFFLSQSNEKYLDTAHGAVVIQKVI